MSPDPPRAVFWECGECGLRYVEAPWQAWRGRRCPHCGGPAAAAAVVASSEPEMESAPAPSPASGPRLAVLLDNLRSAYNVGAAFRTADGAGVAHLYLGGMTPAPPHRGIAKTALGAERHVPWSRHPNGVRLAAALQAEGWVLWALEAVPEAVPLGWLLAREVPERLLLVVGNEVAGVDPALLARADAVVSLPMQGFKRSLNVASALAAALYAVRLGVSGACGKAAAA